MKTADCGHTYGSPEGGSGASGYARLRKGRLAADGTVFVMDGGTVCYACADAMEIEDLAREGTFFAYLSGDRRTVTTWTGGKLGTVIPYSIGTSVQYTPSGGRYETTYLRMTDVYGVQWHGRGPGAGMYVRLRRLKANRVLPIPADHPVKPLPRDAEGETIAECGSCGLRWDDGIVTSMTPAPSARCPFEHYHNN